MMNVLDVSCRWMSIGAACWRRVVALAGRCLGGLGELLNQLTGSNALASSVRWLPPMWQQLIDAAVQLRGQPRQHILQIDPGAVPVELGRLQQAHHHCRTFTGQLAADEQPVAASDRPRPHLVLDVVVVDRHIAVAQESRERHPAVQAVVDRLGNRAAIGLRIYGSVVHTVTNREPNGLDTSVL